MRGLLARWNSVGVGDDPFAQVIITPLPGLCKRPIVTLTQVHFVGRSRIWFDSGGYFVQQGEISYELLCQRLLEYYMANRWADVYVLPDYVPSSDLSSQEVDARIQATIAMARIFSARLPNELRHKALPVVQGHTREQIRDCVLSYLDLGYTKFGFGSFDTGGSGKDINLLTKRALLNLEFLMSLAMRYGFKIHAFGVGTPALIPTLYELCVDSFDSSCWIRTAGYGNVLLPFVGRRNISHGMSREIGGLTYNESSFREFKARSEHTCPFCESFESLKRNRLDQAMHNLLVIRDTVAMLNRGKEALPETAREMVSRSRYTRMLKKT